MCLDISDNESFISKTFFQLWFMTSQTKLIVSFLKENRFNHITPLRCSRGE